MLLLQESMGATLSCEISILNKQNEKEETLLHSIPFHSIKFRSMV